jgi:mono/diheme cytochrome c family protein
MNPPQPTIGGLGLVIGLAVGLVRPAPGSDLAADPAAALAIVEANCLDCHSGDQPQAAVALDRLLAAPDLTRDFRTWQAVAEQIEAGRMPPREAGELEAADREALLAWLAPGLRAAIEANAGDPGSVTLRRLTNAEYDATVRDLTGFDFGLGREFEPDGGGGEGFANTGDVLFVNPGQFDRYLSAARQLADHATILPGAGIVFKAERVGTRGPEPLRDQAQQAVYVWYQKAAGPHVPADGADLREAEYMLACWKHAHRELTGAGSLDQLADAAGLARHYLANWWAFLLAEEPASRYLDLTRIAWRRLPPPDPGAAEEVPAAVTEGLRAIQNQRRSWYVRNPDLYGASAQRRQQDADSLRGDYPVFTATAGADRVHLVVGDAADGSDGDTVRLSDLKIELAGGWRPYPEWLAERRRALEARLAELEKPEAGGSAPEEDAPLRHELDLLVAAAGRFGTHPGGRSVGPAEIVVAAPTVVTLPVPREATKFRGQGRLDVDDPAADRASAQWLVTVGDPPDPAGVLAGAVTVWKRGTEAAKASMQEFNLMKQAFPENFDLRLSGITDNFRSPPAHPRVYWLSDEQLLSLLPERDRAVHAALSCDWSLARNLTLTAEQAADWDTRVLAHLDAFAERAWRGPLAPEERARLHGIFRAAVAAGDETSAGGVREQAAREALVAVLAAPRFLFRIEEEHEQEQPVGSWELATRLSYFLWSSLPDETLRQAAADGSLAKPERLAAEVRRMLADPRSEALAGEFAARWLRFRGFAERAPVDREKFPEFTPELQTAMEAEATAFLADMIRHDRPLRELFGAGHTFLNERLAGHYGVPGVTGAEFRRVEVADQGRGGLLGMAAILASTSYPQRTSPVLRGNWVLMAVLGTPTPPPPADVPPLEEAAAAGAGIRERLKAHRAAAACAACHDRIDPLGFALEGFDVLGRRRDLDDGSAPLDLSAEFVDGTTFTGFEGLRGFLADRRDLVMLQFCRKLLGYALGRAVLPTDLPLVESLRDRILEEDAGISAAVLGIVQSRQFLNRHGRLVDEVEEETAP